MLILFFEHQKRLLDEISYLVTMFQHSLTINIQLRGYPSGILKNFLTCAQEKNLAEKKIDIWKEKSRNLLLCKEKFKEFS